MDYRISTDSGNLHVYVEALVVNLYLQKQYININPFPGYDRNGY